jgi:hypothetical protein
MAPSGGVEASMKYALLLCALGEGWWRLQKRRRPGLLLTTTCGIRRAW